LAATISAGSARTSVTIEGVTTVFGEVAAEYEDVRPGYPVSMATAISGYLGAPPSLVAEIGAGTGKGTAVYARLGGRLVCIEPDPRMAALLTAKFPRAEVASSGFEEWDPPSGGVSVLGGALAWHHVDPATRAATAHAALAPDGVVALIGRAYGFADPDQGTALRSVFAAHDLRGQSRTPGWIAAELTASGLFGDVTLSRHDTVLPLTGANYLKLVTTFSPFRLLAPDRRATLLTALGAAVASTGGLVHLELRTSLTLARR
jgi:SAM-dependent methyltransferase